MPGIAGFISDLPIPREVYDRRLDLMVGAMQHDASCSRGSYSCSEMSAFVGWTCHRRSFADCMPVFNENRDIILFIAGEIFTDSNQIRELRGKGHNFADGDASYVVHLYEEMGSNLFRKLNGWYSGLIMDMRLDRVFLFNDRFGMHRLFIHNEKEGFFFASEAKALLAVLPETREYDPKSLVEYLTCGCTLGDRSLYKGIEVLPGGTIMEFNAGRLLLETRYFDVQEWESQECVTEDNFTSKFTSRFSATARKYLSSREAVAMSLTGGLDSRMVLGALDLPPGSMRCYTFGSMYRDTYDVTVSMQVANACGQKHDVLVLGESFLSKLPSYLEQAVFISDGYLGLSGAAELYANSLARKIAPTRLTGNWGSELLRGVRAYKFIAPKRGFLNPDLQEYITDVSHTFDEMRDMHKVTFAAFQQAPNQGYGRLAIERSQVDLRSPFLDNELMPILYQAPDTLDSVALASAVIAHCKPSLLSITTDRGYWGPGTNLAVAARRVYREALFRAEYVMGHGAPDWLVTLIDATGCYWIEETVIGRHKFNHFRKWIREYWAGYIRDLLLGYQNSCLQTYFSANTIRETVDAHLTGRRNCTQAIDQMLTILLTHRSLLKMDSPFVKHNEGSH